MKCPICNTTLELKTLLVINDSEKRGLFCEKHQSFFGIVDYKETLRELGIDDYKIIINEKEIFEKICSKKISECFE